MDFGQPIVVRSAVTFTHHRIALTLLFTIHGNAYRRDCHAPQGREPVFSERLDRITSKYGLCTRVIQALFY